MTGREKGISPIIGHGYDLAGNRIYREDVHAAADGQNIDEFYTYDGLQRLYLMKRGALNANKNGIETVDTNHFGLTVLDSLGNWTCPSGKRA